MFDLSIGFFGTPRSLDVPQSRIRSVTEWLRARGYRAEILGPDGIENVDVAIFHGPYDEPNLELLQRARAASCRIILDVCEDLPDFQSPWYRPMMRYTVVTSSQALAARLRVVNPHVVVIEDAIEGDLDAIGEQWLSLICREPVVDIVISTCGADEYLKVCLDSVAAATDVPCRVIVVDSAERSEPLQLDQRIQVIRSERRLRCSEAYNRGIAAGHAPYICVLSDDTIVTRGWLEPMLQEVRQRPGICNPLSSCSAPADYDLRIGTVRFLPGKNRLAGGRVVLEGQEGEGIPPERLHTYNPGHEGRFERQWVPAFCSVFPRALYDSVGSFDEGFINSCEDIDFCWRARQLGFAVSINERSFVFHFGAISRGRGRNLLALIDEHRLAIKYEKPLVIIHTGGAFEKWTVRNLDGVGIGGSETAAARVASELTRLGHRVVVFADCPAEEETIDGVDYLHYERFRSFIGAHHADVFVASRNAALLDAPVRAGRRYLWLHDVLPWNPDRLAPNYEKLDAIVCLSPWQHDYVMQQLRIGPEKLMILPYGIVPERFPANIRRRQHRFIYSSSPDRGLDTLLEIFPRIRAELPDAELHVYYGFDNLEKILAHSPGSELQEYIDFLKTRLNQPGVFYHGRIGQKRLAEEMARSDVWLYPTRFTETYCMTALEAQAAGVLCICTDLGSLTTTVGSRGILLKGDAYSEEYRREAVETTISLLRDRRKRNAITARAREWARRQTWSARGREWAALFGTDARTADSRKVDVMARELPIGMRTD